MNNKLSAVATEPVSEIISESSQVFSFRRMADVFRYLLATEHRNLLWIVCFSFLLPLVITLIFTFTALKSGIEDSVNEMMLQLTNDTFFANLIVAMVLVCSIIFGAIMFNNYDNKRVRLRSLTLPASNLEKFIVPIVTFFILGMVLAVIGVWGCNIIGVCIVNIFFKTTQLSVISPESLFGQCIDAWHHGRAFYSSIIFLNALYAFGSIFYHKYSVIKTTLTLYGVLQIGYILAFVTVELIGPGEIREFDLVKYLDNTDNVDVVINNIVVVFQLILSLFFYWLAYMRLKEQEYINRW